MATRKEIESDTASHLMNLGYVDYKTGKLDAKPIMTMGWFLFNEVVDLEMMKEQTKVLCEKVFRYHAVPEERENGTVWKDVGIENMDWDYHLSKIEGFDSEEEWEKYLEKMVAEPLDASKPWWRFIIIEKIPDGRCAILGLTDHTMADGASGVSALLEMCENKVSNPVFKSSGRKEVEKEKETGNNNNNKEAKSSSSSSRKKVKKRALTTYEQLLALAQGVFTPLTEQILPNDMPTRLKQPTGVFPKKWRFATTPRGDHLEVSKLKAIKDRIPGATVNDVLLAITALSIREYYKKIQDPIMKTTNDIRGTYAVNARPSGVDYLSDKWFGNHIVVATTRYPLHSSRVETVLAFRDQSRLKKASPDTLVRGMLVKALSHLPREQVVKMSSDAMLKFSIMISNVVFSLEPLHLFGQQIDDVRFVACSPLGYYAGAATYCDKVSFGLVATEETETDPRELLPLIKQEAQGLFEEVMAMPEEYFVVQDQPKTAPAWLLALLILVVSLVFKMMFF